MTKETNEITLGLGGLDTILKTIKKYSIFEIFKAMILLMLLSVTIRICIDPSFIFKQYEAYRIEYHNAELVARNEKDEQLKENLASGLYKYHADRVFIIQYHNGTKDWQHGTMRFEKCLNNTVSIKEDYVNFNLTGLDLPFYLKENDSFIGNIDELKVIDPVLYDQLKPWGIDYMACILIRDEFGDPQGIFGCTGPKTDIDISTRVNKIHDYLIEDRVVVRNLTK